MAIEILTKNGQNKWESKIVLNILFSSHIRTDRNLPDFIIVCLLYIIMTLIITLSCMCATYFIILSHPLFSLITLLSCFFSNNLILLATISFLISAFASKYEIICLFKFILFPLQKGSSSILYIFQKIAWFYSFLEMNYTLLYYLLLPFVFSAINGHAGWYQVV